MPLMMTDVAKGQEAALQLDLQPLRAEAERERIPLETEKMQQNLQTSKLSQQKELLQIQALVEAQKDDASAKTLIGDLTKDPTFKDLPIPDQMFKIAQHLDASGKFKQGAEFYSRGQTAKLQEAQTQKANFDIQQNKLDRAQSYLTMLNDDGSNVNEVMMAARTDGALTESELKLLSQRGQEALNAGTFKAFKTDALRTINSIKGKAEVAQEADKREQRRIQAAQLEETIRRDTLRNNQFIAALASKEDRVVKQIALKQYTDASIKVPRLVEDLRKAKKDLAALPAVPKPGMFFDSEDPSKDQRAILQETATSIQEELDEAKKTRDTYAQFLPTATRSKINKKTTPTPTATNTIGTKESPLNFPAAKTELVSGKYYNTSRGAAKWDGSKFVKE